jgi:hypothetical protein
VDGGPKRANPVRSDRVATVRAKSLPSVLALAVALFAAGCGDDDDDGGGDAETVTVEQTVTGEKLEPGEGKEGPTFFSTPSENIACHVSAKAARCDIRERSWKPPPEPASCKEIELDYGHGIVLTADGAEFVCAGDTTLGAPATLGYGEASQRGAFRCESEEDGVTCSDVEDGHGFFLSRQSFRIF